MVNLQQIRDALNQNSIFGEIVAVMDVSQARPHTPIHVMWDKLRADTDQQTILTAIQDCDGDPQRIFDRLRTAGVPVYEPHKLPTEN